MVDATGDTGGHWEATVGPWGTTKPYARDAVTEGEGGGQPPGGGGGPGTCGVQDRYCVVKGYLVTAVFGPLLMLVAAVHVATRDKATEAVPGGAEWGVSPPQHRCPTGTVPAAAMSRCWGLRRRWLPCLSFPGWGEPRLP